jgi:uncharacterized damage-inducible protein DinB
MEANTRIEAKLAASERETLLACLDYQRDTVLQKIAGTDEEALRRRVVPSLTTLLGVVKHLAYVERWWFRLIFAGEEGPDPWPEDDPDMDFRIEPEETTEQVVALFRDEVARARIIIAGADLDDRGRGTTRTSRGSTGADFSLRWIVVHVIEETARHLGHMDIIREQVDGTVGY